MTDVTYKTANQLPIMEEVTENTYALVEENGTLKRVSGNNLGGGGGGVKTAIIKSSKYDDMLAGVSPASAETISYVCTNMTFAEARDIIFSGEPLGMMLMDAQSVEEKDTDSSGVKLTLTQIKSITTKAFYQASTGEFTIGSVFLDYLSQGITTVEWAESGIAVSPLN